MANMPRETSETVIGHELPFTGTVQSTADERPSGSFGLAVRDVPDLATTATAVAVDFLKPAGFSLPRAQARPRFVDSFSNNAHGGSSAPVPWVHHLVIELGRKRVAFGIEAGRAQPAPCLVKLCFLKQSWELSKEH